MIRLISFTFLLFVVSEVFSQKDASDDSLSVIRGSQSLLEKRITFFCKGGKLVDIFVQLANEHHFQFSYSDSKIQTVYVKKKDFKSATISDILAHLLENSVLTYLIIGTNIVIVKEKKSTKDSTERSYTDRPSKTTNSKFPGAVESHIYPSSPIVRRMSRQEQKLLNRIYRKELRLKSKRKKITEEDTISSVPKPTPQIYNPPFYKYYIKGSIAWENNLLRYKNNARSNWKNDLNFSSHPLSALAFDAGAGVFIRNFIIESGIEYHTLNIEGQWKDSVRNISPPPPPPPPAIPPPPPLPNEEKVYSYSDHYSIVSFPVRIYLYKQWKKFHLRIGPAIKINFINSSVEKNKFKAYYESSPGNGTYAEKKYSISFATLINLQAGLQLNNRTLVTSGIEYCYLMSPLSKNSIYNLYSDSILLKLSVFYSIGKAKFYK